MENIFLYGKKEFIPIIGTTIGPDYIRGNQKDNGKNIVAYQINSGPIKKFNLPEFENSVILLQLKGGKKIIADSEIPISPLEIECYKIDGGPYVKIKQEDLPSNHNEIAPFP